MPASPPVICARCHSIGCDCRSQWRPQLDRRRGSSSARGYDADWQQFRQYVLRTRPICESEHGCSQVAEEVHHIVKVLARPDLRLMLRMCKACVQHITAHSEDVEEGDENGARLPPSLELVEGIKGRDGSPALRLMNCAAAYPGSPHARTVNCDGGDDAD